MKHSGDSPRLAFVAAALGAVVSVLQLAWILSEWEVGLPETARAINVALLAGGLGASVAGLFYSVISALAAVSKVSGESLFHRLVGWARRANAQIGLTIYFGGFCVSGFSPVALEGSGLLPDIVHRLYPAFGIGPWEATAIACLLALGSFAGVRRIRAATRSHRERRCEWCMEWVHLRARKCRHCGSSLDFQAVAGGPELRTEG